MGDVVGGRQEEAEGEGRKRKRKKGGEKKIKRRG